MRLRTIYALGCLLLFFGASACEDSASPDTNRDMPDSGITDVVDSGTSDADVPDTQDGEDADTREEGGEDADTREEDADTLDTGIPDTQGGEDADTREEDAHTESGLDGAACAQHSDCAGGYCMPSPDWPGGYCSTPDCQVDSDCSTGQGAVDAYCFVQSSNSGFCLHRCQSSQDCRSGYACSSIGNNLAVCLADAWDEVTIDDLEDYPFEITCGLAAENNRASIAYEVATDTTSYLITPIALDGEYLELHTTTLPNQEQIEYDGTHYFQTYPAVTFGIINPMMIPALEQFGTDLQAGTHTLELINTRSQNICHYLLEESTPGTTIDFNIYLVGVGLSAEDAAADADMQVALDEVDALYAQMGVSVGEVRYHAITGDDAAAYQILRSVSDVKELMALSTRPDGGYDEALSVNIFLVRALQIPSNSPYGFSVGLPGPAGLHGTPFSGVAVSTEYFGGQFVTDDGFPVDGNEFTGNFIAHEVGHYLGLFHTTEVVGQDIEPLLDTPICSPADFPNNCPDEDNLMFPLARTLNIELSEGQKFVLRANPLTKD